MPARLVRAPSDALSAMMMRTRILDVFHVELQLHHLFATPTLESLDAYIEQERNRGTRGDQPLSFAQQRLWFWDQLQPGNPLYQ